MPHMSADPFEGTAVGSHQAVEDNPQVGILDLLRLYVVAVHQFDAAGSSRPLGHVL